MDYSILILVYVTVLLLGMFLGFSFKAMMIWIIGGIISAVAQLVLHDFALAIVVSLIAGGTTFYLFINQESS